MVYTIVKMYKRVTIFVKCPECGVWGNIVKSGSRRMIKHCDKSTGKMSQCTLSGMNENFKMMVETEHKKYMRKQLCVVQDEIRNGKHGVPHNKNGQGRNFPNGKMPVVWKMGKNWNAETESCRSSL